MARSILSSNCIDIILKNEGGFQISPSDWGNWNKIHNTDCPHPLRYMSENCLNCKKCLIGTNRGIAARYFAHLYDIKQLTLREIKDIYYHHFWKIQNVESLIPINNDNLILQLFDFGVNTNPFHANKTLQRLIGAKVDGYIGEETLSKVIECRGDILEDYKHARKIYYEYIAQKNNNKIFLKGWLYRVDKTHI